MLASNALRPYVDIVVPATNLAARLIGHAIEVKFCPISLIFDLIAKPVGHAIGTTIG